MEFLRIQLEPQDYLAKDGRVVVSEVFTADTMVEGVRPKGYLRPWIHCFLSTNEQGNRFSSTDSPEPFRLQVILKWLNGHGY